METIKIAVYVPQSVALSARQTSYGVSVFAPTSGHLAEIDAAAMAVVEPFLYSGPVLSGSQRHLNLDAATVDWATVKAAIDREVAERAAREAESAAIHERAVVELVADIGATSPLWKVDSWGADYTAHCTVHVPRTYEPRVKAALESRLDERRAVEAECLRLNTEAKARKLAAEVAKEQKEAAFEIKKTEALASLYTWATHQPGYEHVAVGVQKGYDMIATAMLALVAYVSDALDIDPAEVLIDGTKAYKDWGWETRGDPSPEALLEEDRLEAKTANLALPLHARVAIGSVSRAFYQDDKRTVIPVEVMVPGIPERVLFVNCE